MRASPFGVPELGTALLQSRQGMYRVRTIGRALLVAQLSDMGEGEQNRRYSRYPFSSSVYLLGLAPLRDSKASAF